MGRLESEIWVSASFQIFALTAREMSWVGRDIVREVKCPGEYVLHSKTEQDRPVLRRNNIKKLQR